MKSLSLIKKTPARNVFNITFFFSDTGWKRNAFSVEAARQGPGEVWLGRGRENASVAVSCYSSQQNLVQCCSWRWRESWRQHKSLALCFPPSPRKKQSKIDIEWTAIWKYVTKWTEQGGAVYQDNRGDTTQNCRHFKLHVFCSASLIIS